MALPFSEIRFAGAGNGMVNCPFGLGLVVEDKPTEFSWYNSTHACTMYILTVLLLCCCMTGGAGAYDEGG